MASAAVVSTLQLCTLWAAGGAGAKTAAVHLGTLGACGPGATREFAEWQWLASNSEPASASGVLGLKEVEESVGGLTVDDQHQH